MLKKAFFSDKPIYLDRGVAAVRIIVGALLAYHGQEVFNADLMAQYMSWDVFAGSNARLLVYTGKSMELIAGLSLLLGLFTRLGALMTIGALSYITFLSVTVNFGTKISILLCSCCLDYCSCLPAPAPGVWIG